MCGRVTHEIILIYKVPFLNGMSDISDADVESFIREYVTALQRLIDGKYNEVKSIGYEFGFPLEFPVKVVSFLGKRGIHILFDKSDFFEVQIIKNERPKVKSRWSQFILYSRFFYFKDKAYIKAESDIRELLSFPEMVESHERGMALYYEGLLYELMEDEVDYYVKYLYESNVLEETQKGKLSELYELMEIIINHIGRYEYLLRSGCLTMCDLFYMINSDMETSLFLALNGKYYSANSLLRKILEVNTRCIYLDYFLQLDSSFEERKEEWLNGERFRNGYKKIINDLISDDINNHITRLLNELEIFEINSLKAHFKKLYKKLSLYVHLKPQTRLVDDLTLSFSEFNENKFDEFFNLFFEVIKLSSILLFLKFPTILTIANFSNFPEFSKEEFEKLTQKLLE